MSKIKVLFFCMGNICRSPTAHGIFRLLVNNAGLSDSFIIHSAGTHSSNWHDGHPPDLRSISIAKKFNCDISDIRSRQMTTEDCNGYSYLFAMDEKNISYVRDCYKNKYDFKISKLLTYIPECSLSDVPDPYFCDNFEEVYLMINSACEHLLNMFKEKVL